MCLKKYFLHFGHPKTSFSPWEISQRLGRSKGSEKGWWCQVMSVVLLSLCLQFWSLLCVLSTTDEGDVFDHNYTKGIAKQNNEDSEDDWEVVDNNNLPPSCSLFYTSSYLIGWICVFWRKNTKVLQDIWFNFGYIFYTYFRIKNNNKKLCHHKNNYCSNLDKITVLVILTTSDAMCSLNSFTVIW